ncbi:MAG: DUF4136 domain-containing protein [Gammaproteobacteria bacterium]
MLKNYRSNMLRLMVFAVLSALLTACATGPKVFVNQNPDADFSNYKTFNFEQRLGTDGQETYNSMFTKYLISAATREMEARGYKKSDNADLTINFGLQTKEKIRSTSSPTTSVGGYYGYRGYGAYGGYETTVTQYTEGTFNMDIVDNTGSQKILVWECVLVGKVTDKFRNNMEQSVNDGMGEIFARYPYFAAGFVPPVTEAQ